MDTEKSVAVKLTARLTTQELYDNIVTHSKSVSPEILDTVSFKVISGYESQLRELFEEQPLEMLLGDTFKDVLDGVDLLEIYITTHRDETFLIERHAIQLQHQQI